jgi:hypothetical protein
MRLKTLACPVLLTMGCGGPGDNSAVRAFHPTVRPGQPLPDVVAAGEKAQAYDIDYAVYGRKCPGDDVAIGRDSFEPHIRVTKRSESGKASPGYREIGYESRDAFAKGLAETLPTFYGCEEFHFIFGRYQGWPRADSFTVKVDATGRIVSVSPLSEERHD